MKKFLAEAYNYISQLGNVEGILITELGKKIDFLGFLQQIRKKTIKKQKISSPKHS